MAKRVMRSLLPGNSNQLVFGKSPKVVAELIEKRGITKDDILEILKLGEIPKGRIESENGAERYKAISFNRVVVFELGAGPSLCVITFFKEGRR